MEVSTQFHALATLLPEEEAPVSIGMEWMGSIIVWT
jgi:hypothetical protein